MGDIINDIKSKISLLKSKKGKDLINGKNKTADDISEMQINRDLLNKFKGRKSFTENTNPSAANGKIANSFAVTNERNEGTQKKSNLLLELKNSFGLVNNNIHTSPDKKVTDGENGKIILNDKQSNNHLPEVADKASAAQESSRIKEANTIQIPVYEYKMSIPETKKKESGKVLELKNEFIELFHGEKHNTVPEKKEKNFIMNSHQNSNTKIGLIITDYNSNKKCDSNHSIKETSIPPTQKACFTAPKNEFWEIKKLNFQKKYDNHASINLDNQPTDKKCRRRESPFVGSIKDRINDISSSLEKDRLKINRNKNIISIQDIYIPPTHSKAVIDLSSVISQEKECQQPNESLSIYKIDEVRELSCKLKFMSSSTFKKLDPAYVNELKILYNTISSIISTKKL